MTELPLDISEPDDAPLKRLATVILEDGPVGSAVVYDLARELKIAFSNEAELRSTLSREFGVVYSRRSETFDAAEPKAGSQSLRELLERWAAANDDRGAIAGDIRTRAATIENSGAAYALAAALGLTEVAPDWTLVQLDESVSGALLERVVRAAPTWWLLGTSAGSPSSAAEQSKKRFQALPLVDQNEMAAKMVTEWASDTENWKTNGKRIRKLASVVGGDLSPLVIDAAVNGAKSIVSNARLSEHAPDLLAAIAALTEKANPEVLQAAIDARFSSSEDLKVWLTQLGSVGKGARERSFLMAAVARSANSRALFDPAAFSGLDIATLGKLLSLTEFEPLIRNGLLSHCRKAVQRSLPSKFGLAAAVFAEYPVLEPLAPIELLSRFVEADEASARVARAAFEPRINVALSEAEIAAAQRLNELRSELQLGRAERDEAMVMRRLAEERSAASDERHRLAVASSTAASGAEIRQAQIDALRVFIDQIERLRSLSSVLADPSGLIDQEVSASSRAAVAFGVEIVGVPGEHTAYDPSIHEAAGLQVGEPAELLTPVYRISTSATPLRYGLIRPLPS